MGARALCTGNHKPSFKYKGRDLSWHDLDGSWWHVFECKVCGAEQHIADWYFWGAVNWVRRMTNAEGN